MLILCTLLVLFSLRIAVGLRHILAAVNWNELRFNFLAVGSLLAVGCFLGGANVAYRAIILLFVIPGLLHLRRLAPDVYAKRMFSLTIFALLFCLWKDFFRLALFGTNNPEEVHSNLPKLLFFLGRELAWWWVIAVLLAILIAIFSRSRAYGEDRSKIKLELSRNDKNKFALVFFNSQAP